LEADAASAATPARNDPVPDDPKPKLSEASPCDLARINLQIGARLQLIARRAGQPRNFFATLIGFVEGETVLVKTPTENGLPVQFQEGNPLTVRAFTGVQVFSFETLVDRTLASPFHCLYLRFPHAVVGTPLRKAIRVKVDLPGQASLSVPDGSVRTDTVFVTDLSLSGGLIESEGELGQVGGEIDLAFAFVAQPGNSEMRINARGTIRNLKAHKDPSKKDRKFSHGVEFARLDEAEEAKLRNLIFDAVVGNRQSVV
jgi:c-di-GMP-binding flagellar brake protein YcgR